MTVLCYGDSNTYGYDPRSIFADRYPDGACWTDLLETAGHRVKNCGLNGREIPHRPAEIEAAVHLFAAEQAELLIVMLGGNDLLMQPHFTADQVAARMADFLLKIRTTLPEQPILLITPPPMQPGTWVQEDRLLQETQRLSAAYQAVAAKLHIAFADAALWDIPLAYDGVHFTQQGHCRFGAELCSFLQNLPHI